MRIVDRYIAKSIISIFISTTILFCCLFILIDVAGHLDEYIDRQVPLSILAQYYLIYLPIPLSFVAPITCLIGVLFTYSHLNNGNEIIVLRTSGLNFWQIAKPAICVGLIVTALVFGNNERLVPTSEIESRRIKNENLIAEYDSKKKKKEKILNLTFYGQNNRLYFIDQFDPNTFEMEGVTIIELDEDQNITKRVIAWKGAWTGIAWEFTNAQISTFEPGEIKSAKRIMVFEEPKIMDIKETPEDFLRQRLTITSMNIKDLKDYIAKFSNSGATRAIENLKVDLYHKYINPFGTIVIVLVGLPLAMMTGRRKALTFTSLGIAVTIAFLYYVCNAVGLALGKGGVFPPILAASLAPLIFAIIAIYIIKLKFQ